MALIGGHEDPRFRSLFNSAVSPAVPLDMERCFVQKENWGSGKWNEVVAIVGRKHTPVVSLKFNGTWVQVASGSENARLDAAVNGLIALDIDELPLAPQLSFHHEPEGDGTPADYNAMWKYLEGRYFDKLKAAGWELCVIIMGGTPVGQTGWTLTQMEQALAGLRTKNVYADVYDKGGTTSPWATRPYLPPDDPKARFKNYMDWCKAKGYAAAMPELGIYRWQNDQNQQAAQLDKYEVSPRWPDVRFVIYYDHDVGEGAAVNNGRISVNQTALRSYAKLFKAASAPPEPEPEPGDCSEVEAELVQVKTALAAVTEELSETKTDLTAAKAALAEAETKIANAQAALA